MAYLLLVDKYQKAKNSLSFKGRQGIELFYESQSASFLSETQKVLHFGRALKTVLIQ
jgi:hypothetical protein